MDYRDDYDALRARADAMAQELETLRAETAEHASTRLRQQLATALAELAAAKTELAAVKAELVFAKKLEIRGLPRPAAPAAPSAGRPHDPLAEGIALVDQGRHAEAAALFTKVLQSEPRSEPALAALGSVMQAMGDLDAAQKAYCHLLVLPLDGNSGISRTEVYLALGRIELARGEIGKARVLFEHGLTAAPGDRTLLLELERLI